jgi:putative ABC transport system ATP-binding protein
VALHLQNLKKNYVGPDGSVVPVIDIEDLAIGDDQQVALIGTSGSGKTTLLHLIAGIVPPDDGRILYAFPGEPPIDLAHLDEARRDVFRGSHIGYIFQTHHLLAGFTALENVLLGMSFTGRRADREWAVHLLKEVGLGNRLDYLPAKLSVGQQQRVAVARALANRPKLVLADEPTGALDPNTAQQVLQLIRTLCDEVKASLLLVSHDLAIANQLPRVLTLAEINVAGRAAAVRPDAQLTST